MDHAQKDNNGVPDWRITDSDNSTKCLTLRSLPMIYTTKLNDMSILKEWLDDYSLEDIISGIISESKPKLMKLTQYNSNNKHISHNKLTKILDKINKKARLANSSCKTSIPANEKHFDKVVNCNSSEKNSTNTNTADDCNIDNDVISIDDTSAQACDTIIEILDTDLEEKEYDLKLSRRNKEVFMINAKLLKMCKPLSIILERLDIIFEEQNTERDQETIKLDTKKANKTVTKVYTDQSEKKYSESGLWNLRKLKKFADENGRLTCVAVVFRNVSTGYCDLYYFNSKGCIGDYMRVPENDSNFSKYCNYHELCAILKYDCCCREERKNVLGNMVFYKFITAQMAKLMKMQVNNPNTLCQTHRTFMHTEEKQKTLQTLKGIIKKNLLKTPTNFLWYFGSSVHYRDVFKFLLFKKRDTILDKTLRYTKYPLLQPATVKIKNNNLNNKYATYKVRIIDWHGDSENFDFTSQGQLKAYSIIKNDKRSIMSDQSIETLKACCWVNWEQHISNISKKYCTDHKLKVKRVHGCPLGNCKCCCTNMTKTNLVLKNIKLPDRIIRAIVDARGVSFPGNINVKDKNNKIISHVKVSAQTLLPPNYSNTDAVVPPHLTKSTLNPSEELAADKLISTIIGRFPDIRLTINNEGKVSAALSTPVTSLTTAELTLLSNILNLAQKQVDEIRSNTNSNYVLPINTIGLIPNNTNVNNSEINNLTNKFIPPPQMASLNKELASSSRKRKTVPDNDKTLKQTKARPIPIPKFNLKRAQSITVNKNIPEPTTSNSVPKNVLKPTTSNNELQNVSATVHSAKFDISDIDSHANASCSKSSPQSSEEFVLKLTNIEAPLKKDICKYKLFSDTNSFKSPFYRKSFNSANKTVPKITNVVSLHSKMRVRDSATSSTFEPDPLDTKNCNKTDTITKSNLKNNTINVKNIQNPKVNSSSMLSNTTDPLETFATINLTQNYPYTTRVHDTSTCQNTSTYQIKPLVETNITNAYDENLIEKAAKVCARLDSTISTNCQLTTTNQDNKIKSVKSSRGLMKRKRQSSPQTIFDLDTDDFEEMISRRKSKSHLNKTFYDYNQIKICKEAKTRDLNNKSFHGAFVDSILERDSIVSDNGLLREIPIKKTGRGIRVEVLEGIDLGGMPKRKRGRPRKYPVLNKGEISENPSTVQVDEKPKRRRGRPKKVSTVSEHILIDSSSDCEAQDSSKNIQTDKLSASNYSINLTQNRLQFSEREISGCDSPTKITHYIDTSISSRQLDVILPRNEPILDSVEIVLPDAKLDPIIQFEHEAEGPLSEKVWNENTLATITTDNDDEDDDDKKCDISYPDEPFGMVVLQDSDDQCILGV